MAMPWYKVTLSKADIRAGKIGSLQDGFEALFIALGGPGNAGMFGGLELGGHKYYFSPGAARIAGALIARYAGVECVPPKRSEVAILVADAGRLDEIPFAPEV